jgi:hypothetical protein
MPLLGLTNRQAAKLVGCTHKAIGDAKKTGHLISLSDGSVSPEAVKKWQASRRAPRGGYGDTVSSNPPVKLSTSQVAALLMSDDEQAERALALLTAEGIFETRAAAELHRDSYIARMKQLQFEREAGQVVEVESVAKIVGESLARVRTRLLAIPAEQAPRLHRLKTVGELQDAILECITEALEELVTEAAFEPGE